MPKVFTFGNEVRVCVIGTPLGGYTICYLIVGCGSLCSANWRVGLSRAAGCFGGVAEVFLTDY